MVNALNGVNEPSPNIFYKRTLQILGDCPDSSSSEGLALMLL